jgi:PAS domain S-box-containing protein
MARNFSIRRRLALQALLTGAVMLCLALAFLWAQRETDRAFDRILHDDLAPASELRKMESRLLAIHSRMQAVLLGQASPLGALELLKQERRLIRETWMSFLDGHRNWLLDADEDALIADVDAAMPALWTFLDLTEAAYRIYDPVQLGTLVDRDWFQLQQALLHNLHSLSERQEGHVLAATRELQRSVKYTRTVVVSLLAGGVLCLAFFSLRLTRHIMRRIVGIEQALEAIARGAHDVVVPYRDGETEIARIATAINRTVAQMSEDRDAIAGLMRQQQTILESVGEGIYGVDTDGRVMFINPAALAMLGYEEAEVLGQPSHDYFHHHHADGQPYLLADCPIAASRRNARVERRDDEVFFRKDGSSFPVEYTSAPLIDLSQASGGVVIFRDVSERREQERLLQQTVTRLRETNARLAETQMQLVQAEKLAGLGQLAAGVAHEINNPIGFVNSNVTTLETYVQDILRLIDGYEALLPATLDAAARVSLRRLREEIDIDFVRDDLQALVRETRNGLQRVIRIVADLRDFSRVDSSPAEWGEVDLNHGLDSTLKMMAAVLDGKADVVRDYASLPVVRGNAVQLNQVFMNLLLNAAHAIEHHGTITVRTRQRDGEVCVEIADTGCGMPPEVSGRMFDPFYTTRPVGQGTGLGLSVAYSIVQNHGGHFEVDSTPGQGTAVRMWLPVAQPPAAASAVSRVSASAG